MLKTSGNGVGPRLEIATDSVSVFIDRRRDRRFLLHERMAVIALGTVTSTDNTPHIITSIEARVRPLPFTVAVTCVTTAPVAFVERVVSAGGHVAM
jgi:hypothetical protein